MPTFPADTTPEAAWMQVQVFRKMPPEQRLRMVMDLSRMVRALVAAGVRDRHPDFTSEQINLATIRLTLGEDLFRLAYPNVKLRK